MYNVSDIHVNEEGAEHTLFFLHNLLNGFGYELTDSHLKCSNLTQISIWAGNIKPMTNIKGKARLM